MPNPTEAFLAIVKQYRDNIGLLAIDVKNLKNHEGVTGADEDAIANIILAARHLEDAVSRLGRVQ